MTYPNGVAIIPKIADIDYLLLLKVKVCGTGSYPPLQNGLHLAILHIPSAMPFMAPKRSIASAVYSEQVGRNLHVGYLLRGEMYFL